MDAGGQKGGTKRGRRLVPYLNRLTPFRTEASCELRAGKGFPPTLSPVSYAGRHTTLGRNPDLMSLPSGSAAKCPIGATTPSPC